VVFLINAGASREEAEDAAQDAMMRAYRQWMNVEHPAAWVRVVGWRSFVGAAVQTRETEQAQKAGWVNVNREDQQLMLLGEQERAVLRLLGELPPIQRLVMAWHYDGFSPTEIAEILDKPPATIRSDLRHARSRLKGQLFNERRPAHDVCDIAAKPGPATNEPRDLRNSLDLRARQGVSKIEYGRTGATTARTAPDGGVA
jgi:RNA polymerase sigma factor (sigma-70 family)